MKVRVKELQWRKPADHPQDNSEALWVAPGLGGQYSITPEEQHFLLWDADDNFSWSPYPSIAAAKAAAQSDYERRILSAIEVSDE